MQKSDDFSEKELASCKLLVNFFTSFCNFLSELYMLYVDFKLACHSRQIKILHFLSLFIFIQSNFGSGHEL